MIIRACVETEPASELLLYKGSSSLFTKLTGRLGFLILMVVVTLPVFQITSTLRETATREMFLIERYYQLVHSFDLTIFIGDICQVGFNE